MSTLTKKQKEQLQIGAYIQSIYESGSISKRNALTSSFLKGVVSGLGAVIGGTVVLTLFIWTLSLFSEVPFVGRVTETVTNTINNQTNR